MEPTMAKFDHIPTPEVLADYRATMADILACHTALAIGIETTESGDSISERLSKNESTARTIMSILRHRGVSVPWVIMMLPSSTSTQ